MPASASPANASETNNGSDAAQQITKILIVLGARVTVAIISQVIPTPKHLESKLEMVSEYRMGGIIC